jgi:hypothetical protein
MGELQPPDLDIWGVGKVIFSNIFYLRSKAMVLYPSSRRVQQAEEHLNWSSYEEMVVNIQNQQKVCRPSVRANPTHTVRPYMPMTAPFRQTEQHLW